MSLVHKNSFGTAQQTQIVENSELLKRISKPLVAVCKCVTKSFNSPKLDSKIGEGVVLDFKNDEENVEFHRVIFYSKVEKTLFEQLGIIAPPLFYLNCFEKHD